MMRYKYNYSISNRKNQYRVRHNVKNRKRNGKVPFLNRAFSFQPISITEYLVALALALAVIPIVEIVKFFQRRAAGTGQK